MKKIRNPKDITLHMIGNAHLDPVWLWRWDEGLAEAKATFQSALDRMKETPGFIFTRSDAALYEWIEQNAPRMFREIKRRVAEGRWNIVGGWWVQADCNLPSGESLVRHGLYAQQYFRAKFGRICRVGYCVDAFGHPATLPKLLAGCGLEGYVWMRPDYEENPDIPGPCFWWRSPDGSRVLAMRIQHQGYGTPTVDELEKRICDISREESNGPFASEMFCFYGVGNHGGGPTKAQIAAIEKWKKAADKPNLVYSSPDHFLEVARKKRLQTYEGEFQHHARGCYSAVSEIKALNRRAEEMLQAAERWGAAARIALGKKPCTGALAGAWKDVLFNQDHDILTGCSLSEAYLDARYQMGSALHGADCALNNAQQAISWNIDTRVGVDSKFDEGAPVVFFNNQVAVFKGIVETHDYGFHTAGGRFHFVDTDGSPVPFQDIPLHTLTFAEWGRAVIPLSIPSLGYTVLHVRPGKGPDAGCLLGAHAVKAGTCSLENEYLKLMITKDGFLELRDKRTGSNVFENPAGSALVLEDKSDTWSHGVSRFDKVIGRFEKVSSNVFEAGPVRGGIQVIYRYMGSLLKLDYLLGAGEPFVGIRGEVDWHDRWKMVKIAFPVNIKADYCTAEVPYGTIERPTDGKEEPMQQWVDVSSEGAGLTVANDCKYGYDMSGNEIRITILRSPPYAYNDPVKIKFNDEDRNYMDQGKQNFNLALIPHRGDWREAGVIEVARQLNFGPTVLFEHYHSGNLPARASFLECTGKGVLVNVVKEAEEGGGLIIRGSEWFGRKSKADFYLPGTGRKWRATFKPGEIKSFFIPDGKGMRVGEVNMLEKKI